MSFKNNFLFFSLAYNLLDISSCFRKEPRVIVCFGDSLATCGGSDGKYTDHLQQLLPRHSIINRGVSGDTLAGGRKRLKENVLKLRPDIVVIELGSNDYWNMERSINDLKEDFEYIVKQCADRTIKVVIVSCFGDKLRTKVKEAGESQERAEYALEIAKMETGIVKKYNCFYVSNLQVDIKPNTKSKFWTDNNHPNKLGNKLVAKRILKTLKKALTKS